MPFVYCDDVAILFKNWAAPSGTSRECPSWRHSGSSSLRWSERTSAMFTSRSFPDPAPQVNKYLLTSLDILVPLWMTVIASKYVMDKWFLPFVILLLMMVTSGFLCMFFVKDMPPFWNSFWKVFWRWVRWAVEINVGVESSFLSILTRQEHLK